MRDVEGELVRLGEWRRGLGERLLENGRRFEAIAREVAKKVAADIVYSETDLCPKCDADAYCHAIDDLTALLTDHVAADLVEGVRMWLETRKAGAP